MGHFDHKFQTEWGVALQPLLVSETRVIALPRSIKISAVHNLVLSQCTHLTDGWTDGRTDRQTELHRRNEAHQQSKAFYHHTAA